MSSLLQLGDSVTDPAVFRDLAAYWEDSFFNSMSALHVERPTTLTRVSEYIPEIVSFVEGIVARGFAYEGGGSVWFDTVKFEGADGEEKLKEGDEAWKHTYAKLQPWSKGNRELLEDGEGAFLLFLSSFNLDADHNFLQVRLPALPESALPLTSLSGSPRSRESPLGLRLGVPVAPAGTSSARSWRAPSSARTWMFTPAVSISPSLITTMKSLKAR
jgi:hypothetical protein